MGPGKEDVGKTFVKLHSNLQTQLNFSWLEKELTLFSHGRRKEGRKEEGRTNPHLASGQVKSEHI